MDPNYYVLIRLTQASCLPRAKSKSSEVCGIIKPGRRVKLNRSQAVKCPQFPQTSGDSLLASRTTVPGLSQETSA